MLTGQQTQVPDSPVAGNPRADTKPIPALGMKQAFLSGGSSHQSRASERGQPGALRAWAPLVPTAFTAPTGAAAPPRPSRRAFSPLCLLRFHPPTFNFRDEAALTCVARLQLWGAPFTPVDSFALHHRLRRHEGATQSLSSGSFVQ